MSAPCLLPGDCWEGLLPPSDPKQKMGGWIFFIPKDTNTVVCLLWWPAQLQRLWNNHPLRCAGSLEITLTHSETPVQMHQPPWKSHQVIWHVASRVTAEAQSLQTCETCAVCYFGLSLLSAWYVHCHGTPPGRTQCQLLLRTRATAFGAAVWSDLIITVGFNAWRVKTTPERQ